MKTMIRFAFVLFLILGAITSSCKKEEKLGSGQIEFSLAMAGEVQSSLKSASVAPLSVVITIEDDGGNAVKNSEKLQLYAMGGDYITQPISLLNGNYKLTRFLVLDAGNNVLYASPLKGSSMAYLVQNPLAVDFSVEKDKTTKLIPEVIAANESTPESFGYTTFSYSVTETFDFLIAAFIYNEGLKNYELTSADISISSGSTPVYSGQLSTQTGSSNTTECDSIGVTNKITLPENYDDYSIVISKAGYKTYTQTFTKDELKLHYRSIDKGPLVVILEPEVADDSEFYIRGYFGGEYLNYTYKHIGDLSCSYISYYSKDTIRQSSLGLVAGASASAGCKSISIGIDGVTGTNRFDIDNLTMPYTFMQPSEYVWGQLSYQTNGYNSCVFCEGDDATYFGITRGPAITITIDSKSNDVVIGHFSGEIQTVTGKKLTVTGGEFKGKFNRRRIDI